MWNYTNEWEALNTDWYRGVSVNSELTAECRAQIATASRAFEILTGILEDKIKSKDTERNSVESYERPSYPYYQADCSGYVRALREVQRLLDLQDKESL